MSTLPLEQLSEQSFFVLLKTKFRVRLDSAQFVELELVQVTPGRADIGANPARGLRQESFSLLFNGPEHPFLPQCTYRFEHDQLGQFDLFVVPIGREQAAFQYQVVFNRLIRQN
jgi:hypothetical protein